MDFIKYKIWMMRALTHRVRRPGRDHNMPERHKVGFLNVPLFNSMRPLLKSQEERVARAPFDLMKELCLKTGDVVQVLHGPDQGRMGLIKRAVPGKNQVIVSGMNLVRRFTLTQTQKDATDRQRKHGSLVTVEAPIHVTNVVPLDPVLKQPTRLRYRKMLSGRLVRISKLSRSAYPEPIAVPDEMTRRDKLLMDSLRQKANIFRGVPISDKFRDSVRLDKEHADFVAKVIATARSVRNSP